MTGLVGTVALAAGFAATLTATVAWGLVARGNGPARTVARRATWLVLGAALLAAGTLEVALLTSDFSIRYVAENGSRAVPTYYRAISLWAGLEGSLLLWLLVHAAFTVAVLHRVPARARDLQPVALAVLTAVALFFFGLALFAGNAFEPVLPVPTDGPGPNPLLQDHPLMGVHPPLLYLGFVGLSVPFAYAVAGLISGRTGSSWLAATRGWTLGAWSFLTLGIVVGGWWSYAVLGWGGYWAWDPVENASLLPWLTTTALLHSMMVQERRPTLRAWNVSLAAASFLLVLLGTFLTRSGIVNSVHAFSQSAVGPLLLGFIGVVLLLVVGLLIFRIDRLGPTRPLDPTLSRETVFLGNNVLLVGLAFTVLLGTVFPLVVEAVTGDQVSVGAPYFNRMAVPIALALVLLMGVGPLVPWGQAEPRALARRLAVPAVVGLATTGALGLAGLTGATALLTFGLAAFVLATIVARFTDGARAMRRAQGWSWPVALTLATWRRRRHYGGLIVHAGVVLAAVAIAASSTYSSERSERLEIGQTATIGDYAVRLVGVDRQASDRRMSVVVRLSATEGDRALGTLAPMVSFYPSSTQAVATPGIAAGAGADLYVTAVEVDESGTWAVVALRVNPLVSWLWVAGGVMGLGALLAGLPGGRRRPARVPVQSGDARAGQPESSSEDVAQVAP